MTTRTTRAAKHDCSNFDSLPDSAMVPVTIFESLAGIAVSTAWRRAKNEPDFPKPIRLGGKCTRFKVADIRRFLARASKA